MRDVFIVTHFEKKQSPAMLLAYAKRLYKGHETNPNYPANVNPTVAQFLVLINNLEAPLNACGTRKNHGTSQDYQDRKDAMKALKKGITGLKYSDQNTTPGNADAFLSAGWEISSANAGRVGALPAPANLRVIYENNTVIPGRIHYGWDAVPGAHGYIVWTGTGTLPAVPPDASLPSHTVTHAHFEDHAPSGENRWIIVGCVGTNPLTGYATLANTIVP